MTWHLLFMPTAFRWLPIRSAAQAVLAESLADCLEAGLPIDEALKLAGKVNPSRRLRTALLRAADNLYSGESLEQCLASTGIRLSEGLLAALRKTRSRASLVEDLRAFALSCERRPEERLRRALRRSPQAIRFAAALARHLRTEAPLNPEAVSTAGRLAAGSDRRFLAAVESMRGRIREGDSLGSLLERHPRYFDPLFCRFVQKAKGPEELRRVLERLGGPQPAATPSEE